jgi:hypothetical protein
MEYVYACAFAIRIEIGCNIFWTAEIESYFLNRQKLISLHASGVISTSQKLEITIIVNKFQLD